MSWPGIEIRLNRESGEITTVAADMRETEATPANSSSGIHNVSQAINIYDGNWHNLLYMWSMNDNYSFPEMSPSDCVSALRKGILVVDGFIIPNESALPGKQTPFNFIHNLGQKLPTFISIGGQLINAGISSAAVNTQVNQVFSGQVQRIAIWDRPLPDASTNFNTTVVARPDAAAAEDQNPARAYWTSLVDPLISSTDVLTGNLLATNFLGSISANLVVYHKYDELAENAISAIDYSGTAVQSSAGLSGAQVNPDFGNPANFSGVEVDLGDYLLRDVIDLQANDAIMKTGFVAFEDQNQVQQRVGFINYDLGFVVLDGEFNDSGGITGVPFLRSIGTSGMTFASSLSSTNFYVRRINFTSQEFVERMVINVTASGTEMNQTENPTGVDETTGGQLLTPSATWPQSVGLYTSTNDLIGIAKFNHPIRKDEDHNVVVQVKLDFGGSYLKGSAITP